MAVFSTYRVYKQGTHQVVAWLLKTAADFGYNTLADTSIQEAKKLLGFADIPILEKQGNRKFAGRRNQEERKAKKAASKSNGDSTARCEATKIYTVAELSVLAKFISMQLQQTWKKNPRTFKGILRVLEDVIARRKEWSKAFTLPDASTLASNKRHKHFVTVLEEVYQTLRGAMSTLQQQGNWERSSKVVAPRDVKSSSMEEETALRNLFAVLDIEELPASDEESVDLDEGWEEAPAPKSSKSPTTTTYDIQDEEMDNDELHFMIYCFFKDFQTIREHISQSWRDYKSGKLDLVAVAVMTNSALEMLQREETELLESLPEECNLNSYELISAFLMTEVAPTLSVDPKFFLHDGKTIEPDERSKSVMDFTCWQVYIALLYFSIPQGEGEHLRVLEPGKIGKIDLTGQPLSWEEKLNQARIVLYELLPELCILKDMRLSIPYLDELSAGLMQMIQTGKISISLVFACQIYLDIHQCMLSSINMAHTELQTMGRHFSTTLQEFLDFSKTVSYVGIPFVRKELEQNKEAREKISRKYKLEADLWVNQDMLAANRRNGLKKLNLPEDSTVRPYSLLSRHPMLCGILLFRMNLILEEGGINLADSFFSFVVNVIHLYNAVKRESREHFPLWQDLEAIIEVSGESRLFMGEYPKTPAAYLKRWMQLQGAGASTFAQTHRLRRRTDSEFAHLNLVRSKHDHRGSIKRSYTGMMFKGQYVNHGKRYRPENSFQAAKMIMDRISSQERTGNNMQRLHPFTAISFLQSIRFYIQSDIVALNINYYALHYRCTSLLRNLSVKLQPYLNFEAEFRLGDIGLQSSLVGQLLKMAAEADLGPRFHKRVPLGAVGKGKAFIKAGKLVKKLVQREGDRELERVKSVCRGFAWMTANTSAGAEELEKSNNAISPIELEYLKASFGTRQVGLEHTCKCKLSKK